MKYPLISRALELYLSHNPTHRRSPPAGGRGPCTAARWCRTRSNARWMLPRLQDLVAPLGADPTQSYNHINCVPSANAFFNNVRTPAALLVIPALNSLWLDLSSTTKRTKVRLPRSSRGGRCCRPLLTSTCCRSRISGLQHPVAQTLYTFAVLNTVLLELVCVFVATVAGTRLMAGGFDPSENRSA